MTQGLTRRERQIMDILFQFGEANAHQVQHGLPDPPSYSTVRALLARLVDKKLVKIRAEGNRYCYSPTEDPDRASRSAMRHLVSTFFEDSPLKAANALLGMEPETIDSDELERLRELINRFEREAGQ